MGSEIRYILAMGLLLLVLLLGVGCVNTGKRNQNKLSFAMSIDEEVIHAGDEFTLRYVLTNEGENSIYILSHRVIGLAMLRFYDLRTDVRLKREVVYLCDPRIRSNRDDIRLLESGDKLVVVEKACLVRDEHDQSLYIEYWGFRRPVPDQGIRLRAKFCIFDSDRTKTAQRFGVSLYNGGPLYSEMVLKKDRSRLMQ